MTQDEIIRMAREAGFETDEAGVWITDGYWTKELERFAALVAAHEREACAKVCESAADKQIIFYPKGYYIDPNKWGSICQKQADRCAAAIRARGEK